MCIDKYKTLVKMRKSQIKKNSLLVVFLVFTFILMYNFHSFLLNYLEINQNKFEIPLIALYLFLGSFTVLILAVLINIRQKNIDLVGNTFMLLTVFKMIIVVALSKFFLNSESIKASVEKQNVLLVFLLFLATETLYTVHLLRQEN